MPPFLSRYGDTWTATALGFLLSGLAVVVAAPAMSPIRALAWVGGALLLATGLSTWLVWRREARRRPTLFLTPKRREAAILGLFLLIATSLVVGFIRRPPTSDSDPPSQTVADRLKDLAKIVSENSVLRAEANLNQALTDRKHQNEETIRQGGPQAEVAAAENREIDRYQRWVDRQIASVRPKTPGEPPKPPDLSSPPPLPRLSQRREDPGREDPLTQFLGLLAGPLASFLRGLLGASLGSGYTSQVMSVTRTMADGVAPSVGQIEGLLDAAENGKENQVEAALRKLGQRQLSGRPDQLQEFFDHLRQAHRSQPSAAEQIRAQLERDPETPHEVLLGYLGTSAPYRFASAAQKKEVQEAIETRYPDVWSKVFARLPVQGGPEEGQP